MKRLFSILALALSASFLVPVGCDSAQSCAAHEDCEADEACLFNVGKCSLKCTPGEENVCPNGGTCDPCATSACPTCENCMAACTIPASQGAQGDPGGW